MPKTSNMKKLASSVRDRLSAGPVFLRHVPNLILIAEHHLQAKKAASDCDGLKHSYADLTFADPIRL